MFTREVAGRVKPAPLASYCEVLRFVRADGLGLSGSRLSHLAVLSTINEINEHADYKPDKQAYPRSQRESKHQTEGGERTQGCDDPDKRGFEFPWQARFANAQY